LSADNIRKRDRLEIDGLFWLIEHEIPKRVRAAQDWQLHVSGDTSLLPDSARNAHEAAISDTHGRPSHLTVAIGYDAHEDILGAVRRALVDPRNHELSRLSVGSVSEQLAGGPVKEIDLVIRTGGDHRISGFFPWQSKAAELFVTRRTWPDFAEDDLDDALAFYARKATGAQTSRSTAT
jgi:short-chain Z-isoprenyl diphosphate synthase